VVVADMTTPPPPKKEALFWCISKQPWLFSLALWPSMVQDLGLHASLRATVFYIGCICSTAPVLLASQC
jgi:hypothetical protein